MKAHTSLLLAVAAHLAVFGAGCKRGDSSDESSAADPTTAEVDPANATDVGPTVAADPLPAPPEPKADVQGTAPSDHHVWIEGYWWWDTPKREYMWSPGFWQDRMVVATAAPPALLYEYPGRAPSASYTYVPGYWMWRGTEYVWYHGYWGHHRDGWAYVHPYWEMHNGHWGCSAFGWDRYHAGFETEHVGWEYHAGIWERPAEFQARVAVARVHAADFRVTPGTWHGHVYGRADADIHGHVTGLPAGHASVHPGDTVHETHAIGHANVAVRPGGHVPEVHGEVHAPAVHGEVHAPAVHGEVHAPAVHAEGHVDVHERPPAAHATSQPAAGHNH
jgi:hypothetical protein